MSRHASTNRALLLAAVALASCGGGGADEASLPSRFGLRGRWADPSELTYTLEGRGADELARACRSWSELGPVAFRPARPGEEPDFTVTWERGAHAACMPFGADPGVAHTGPIDPQGGTFVHLDAGRAWDTDGGPSLSRALLHELGHVLGLDHSPDPLALMYADPRTGRITRSDRDAFWSLYGGGEIDDTDVVVSRDGKVLTVVHGVATPGHADFELFDTDGDGDDELVVWRIDAEGSGEITSFHFAPGPVAEYTRGPRLGMTDASARTDLLATDAGERVLVIEYPNGNRTLRRFDDDGHLHALYDAELSALPAAPDRRLEGDLDGDGARERVARGDS